MFGANPTVVAAAPFLQLIMVYCVYRVFSTLLSKTKACSDTVVGDNLAFCNQIHFIQEKLITKALRDVLISVSNLFK